MKRRNFIESLTLASGIFAAPPMFANRLSQDAHEKTIRSQASDTISVDLIIAGGGLGGCAAALAALRNGLTVVMTEETDWIGGQLTQQGVPPDEHPWIESHGATELYRTLRKGIREYYRQHYPLRDQVAADPHFNPGGASVSRLAHEPRVALAVLEALFAPYVSSGKLLLLKEYRAISADTRGNKILALQVRSPKTGTTKTLKGHYFVDATELGDLLPMTETAYVTGAESRPQTGELHAADAHEPENNQSFTHCFAIDYAKGEDWTIPRPDQYSFWRGYKPDLDPPWPGKLLELNYSNPRTLQPKALGFHPEGNAMGDILNLWNYRRIIDKNNFAPETYQSDITIVNYPQNDYFFGNIVDVSPKALETHFENGRQLSLSLLYWLQTEAPRPDGGRGWPGLRLRGDIMGTEGGDGLAKYPYIRESRRIKALFTVKEQHVGKEQRAKITGLQGDELVAETFDDSVGIGYYHIDLHPSSGGDNYIDFGSLPFQIPLGALIPRKMENLFPANKNIGTTHLTNGCYRLHPVEWSIGEAVGMLVPFLMEKGIAPQQAYKDRALIQEFQKLVRQQGIETEWPAQN
ncbi:FAD-dependent oxidoreductase [Pricia sp. S334]|uniref:FAD-dependent oxidoreductase n=1 Tax=Pricia mediterranea TaxID=3076079 RepID=A0ABU3L8Q8_9FLAO|nr:FAD-dependent oxidoreductase [Pricia sp. S334]MDT7830119.1 FAD-dependent oxidoreductase [Pricia sp. S334]